METARPNSNSCPTLKLQPCGLITNLPSASAAVTQPSVPPTAPARVFLGDSTGASLGPPKAEPSAIAAVSQIQVITSGNSVSSTYASGRLAAPVGCRMAIRNASRPEAYRQPKIVTATLVSGRAVGPGRTIAIGRVASSPR